MTYEEIASSRSAGTKKQEHKVEEDNSPDRDSEESIEPLEERDIKATGPDPFDKLNYRGGEQLQKYPTSLNIIKKDCIHECSLITYTYIFMNSV